MALTSRNGNDLTEEFAVLAGGLGDALAGRAAVLDGELVVLNEAFSDHLMECSRRS